jgi:hypothetical protein
MSVRQLLVMVWVTWGSMLALTACTSLLGSEGRAGGQASATETISISDPEQSSDDRVASESTPLSGTELARQPEGQVEPGAALDEAPPAEPSPEAGQEAPGDLVTYTDSAYQFVVEYPAAFLLRSRPAERMAQLKPEPIVSLTFMNPETAASDVPELEAADFEVRVYDAGETAALDSWLTSNGLLPADGSVPLKPFQTASVTGVQLCASTMIVPRCSNFVMGNGWVYQLIPITQAGHAIMQTFKLTS